MSDLGEERTIPEVIELILDELYRARKKFPEWPPRRSQSGSLSPEEIVHTAGIVCEEAGELMKAALQHADEYGSVSDCDKEAIQTAATCIRFLQRW